MDKLPALSQVAIAPSAFSDSNWGADTTHRRSVSGILIMVAGAAVVYKTHYQKAVALSSTEAEFVSASDAGKMALYVRSLLHDLGFPQPRPTPLHIDNRGALHMVTASAPTKRTRHVDIRYLFALIQWTESGQVKACPIPMAQNISDSLTNATGCIKFHQHADLFMGRQRPHYLPSHQLSQCSHLSTPLSLFLPPLCPGLASCDMIETSALHFPLLHQSISYCLNSDSTELGRVKGLQ